MNPPTPDIPAAPAFPGGADGRPARWRRWLAGAAGGLVLLALAVMAAEAAGWPFLVAPMERALGQALQRPVRLSPQGVQIQLLGGISVQAQQLEVGTPSQPGGAPLLRADNSHLRLRYTDLWRAYRGQPLRVQRVEVEVLRLDLRRAADGRANWDAQEPAAVVDPAAAPRLPLFDALRVAQGRLVLDDALLDSQVTAQFSLVESSPDGAEPDDAAPGLHVKATGRYRRLPLVLSLDTAGVLPWTVAAAGDGPSAGVPLVVQGEVGRARLRFDGRVNDVQQLAGLSGKFSLSGPSLAAVGDVVGVTLPTTAPFTSRGVLVRQGALWNVRVDQALVGGSRLTAALRYDGARAIPLLIGRLGGSRLLLADLGPVVGTAAPAAPGVTTAPGKVLPAREFDLPALRVMEANVLVDFAELDLGTPRLKPLKPLSAHLILQGGVLSLNQLDTRTAEGRLRGSLSLDGRTSTALWRADLRWSDVRLERWLQLAREPGQPAWITGRLEGRTRLAGQGRSTAQILASLDGELRAQLRDGSVSHLLVEAAGIDLAQGLGVLLKGDDALPMSCALAQWQIQRGVVRPKLMVLDTRDSLVQIEGTVSLATEALDLRALVTPKDISPLALRTPVRVRGSLGSPQVSLEAGPLGGKLLASGLLALINPLGGLVAPDRPGWSRRRDGRCAAARARLQGLGCSPGQQARGRPRTRPCPAPG